MIDSFLGCLGPQAKLIKAGRSDWVITPDHQYFLKCMMYFVGTRNLATVESAALKEWIDKHIGLLEAGELNLRVNNIDFVGVFKSQETLQAQDLVFTEQFQTEIKSSDLKVADGNVLIRTNCSAVSAGTEMKIFKGEFEQSTDVETDSTIAALSGDMQYPLTYGYCLVGTVASEVKDNDEASSVRQGDRVFAFHPHCTYAQARAADLMKIPSDISFADAVFLPSMETALSLVQDAQPRVGERIAVFGQGIIGLLVVAILTKGSTAGKTNLFDVGVSDLVDLRLRMANQLSNGSVHLVDMKNKDKDDEYDVCIDVTGAGIGFQLALDKVRFGGRVVIGSWYGTKPIKLTLGTRVHRSHINVVFSQVSYVRTDIAARWSKARRMGKVWSMIRDLQPSKLISHRVPFVQEEIQQTYANLRQSPRDYLQVVFVPQA
jgi:threonine dehydrogenase-like Zn-dependent dehydrogenase